MIKAAFLTPHSPILIPAIGKNNGVLLAKTAAAYQIIETRLLKEEIDTIIIITPHGAEAATTPTLNVAPSFNLGFAEFGDLATKAEIKGDPVFAQEIKEALKPERKKKK